MRIRKQARISAPSTPPSAIPPNTPPPLVCELNLSPWDIIDCSLPSHNEYQVDLNDNHTCNGIKTESGYTSNSTLASLKEQHWEEIEKKVGEEEVEEQRDKQKRLSILLVKEEAKEKNVKAKKARDDYIRCTKTNGNTWRCKNEAKEGQLFCEHHLRQRNSYRYNYGNIRRKSVKLKQAVPKYVKKRTRVPSSPKDFYYYSGFGPLWGRNPANEIKEEDFDVSNDLDHSSSSSLVDISDIHVHDYDDSDDDYDENKGSRKRIRKPIKERSLKSLFKPIYTA